MVTIYRKRKGCISSSVIHSAPRAMLLLGRMPRGEGSVPVPGDRGVFGSGGRGVVVAVRGVCSSESERSESASKSSSLKERCTPRSLGVLPVRSRGVRLHACKRDRQEPIHMRECVLVILNEIGRTGMPAVGFVQMLPLA